MCCQEWALPDTRPAANPSLILSPSSLLSLSQENTIAVVGKCFLNLGSAGAADLLQF